TGTTRGSRCDEVAARESVFGLGEHRADGCPHFDSLESNTAVRRLGISRRGMAPGCEGVPRSERRLLGLHRREAPLHPLRHLSLRAALAAGARHDSSGLSLGIFSCKSILALVAGTRMARGSD